jgi:hypothetical protein
MGDLIVVAPERRASLDGTGSNWLTEGYEAGCRPDREAAMNAHRYLLIKNLMSSYLKRLFAVVGVLSIRQGG